MTPLTEIANGCVDVCPCYRCSGHPYAFLWNDFATVAGIRCGSSTTDAFCAYVLLHYGYCCWKSNRLSGVSFGVCYRGSNHHPRSDYDLFVSTKTMDCFFSVCVAGHSNHRDGPPFFPSLLYVDHGFFFARAQSDRGSSGRCIPATDDGDDDEVEEGEDVVHNCCKEESLADEARLAGTLGHKDQHRNARD